MDDHTTIIGTEITMLLRREACLPIPNAVLMLAEPAAKRLQLTLILTLHQRSDAPKRRAKGIRRLQVRDNGSSPRYSLRRYYRWDCLGVSR